MPVVAGEQLVPTVSRQRHGDLSARLPANQVGGDLGDVGEGFVPDVRVDGAMTSTASASPTWTAVWSVPRYAATAVASADSSKDRSANPTVKVRTDPVACCCIRATMALESIPPERNAPTGTSATIRAATAFDNVASSWSVISESEAFIGCRRARATASAADQ